LEEYSKRLGKIAPEQFQAALARFFLGDFVKAEKVPYGLFGQNVFVTSSQGEFVLRGVPHYDWQFPTECFFTEQLHQNTAVPVPYPYLFEESTDIFGWCFAIMPRLPGVSVLDKTISSTLSLEDRLAAACALASTLAEAHTFTWHHVGKYDYKTGCIRSFDQSYGEWLVAQIRQNIAKASGYNDHTTASDRAWVDEILEANADVLVNAGEPSIVFGDYGGNNVVFEQAHDGWRVSGVFDLMTAYIGDGNADLCVPVAGYLGTEPVLADAFVGEYLRCRPAWHGFAQRQQIYALGLYASTWEYWQRVQGGTPQDQDMCFRQWAGRQVAYWSRWIKGNQIARYE